MSSKEIDFSAIRARIPRPVLDIKRRDGESSKAYRARLRNEKGLRNWHAVQQNNLCAYCEVWMAKNQRQEGEWGTRITLDHIRSLADGGLHTVENTHAICFACNMAKGDLSHETYGDNWRELRQNLVDKIKSRRANRRAQRSRLRPVEAPRLGVQDSAN